MGQSKGGGYMKQDSLSPQQMTLLNQLLGQSANNSQQAAQGFQQFLPGGGGGQSIINDAMRQYQQTTLPQITNLFGSGAKGSSALNQALGASASNLNSGLASQLAQMQLSAAGGLGSLAQGQGQLGLGTPAFQYQQRQPPIWQQLLGPLIGGGSQLGGAYLGRGQF
jgi:hypothetical protein